MQASIIIPVKKDINSLRKVMTSLDNQSGRIVKEVIVVNNGAKGDLDAFKTDYPNATYLDETEQSSSPYSARNRGIEICKGEVIIFLDATCTPTDDWLEKGLEFIASTGSDLVGGNVLFDYGSGYNAAKIYDSLVNIQMKSSILKRKVAKTANLFVKREVIEKIGMFPEGIRSGGDVRWTHKATSNGFKLAFSEDAKVFKETRSYIALLKKQWRISVAHPAVWKEDGREKPLVQYFKAFRWFPTPKVTENLIKERGSEDMMRFHYRVWFFSLWMHLLGKIAHLVGYYKLKKD
jgi:glycosyltransferase involved in cell wall biosynthesis